MQNTILVDEILRSGVANVIPAKEELKKLLLSGKKLNIYLGIDPTAPKIHLGHAVPLIKLQQLAELGHNVTLLIGDFTALVGDTSDKEAERPILNEREIEENFKTYKNQASKILDFSKVTIKKNSEWLSKLTYSQVFKLKQQFSLNDFISRELIKKRLEAGQHIRLDETEYPIMQGYDSYFLDTDIQVGGADQTFNMQAGRVLQKKLRNKESFILATEFLMGTDSRKMSKSWNNAIWLEDTASEMYGKIMSIKDDLIIHYFNLATSITKEQIKEIEKNLAQNKNPMEIKKQLAFEIVSALHDKNQATSAQKDFEEAFQKGNKESLIVDIIIPKAMLSDASIAHVIFDAGGTASISEAKSLIEQGAVQIDNKKVSSFNLDLKENSILNVGRRKVYRIKAS